MANPKQNTNVENVKAVSDNLNNQNYETCEISSAVLEEGITLESLAQELSLEGVVGHTFEGEANSDDIELALFQSEKEEVPLPPQEVLKSLAQDAQDAAKVEPAAGDEQNDEESNIAREVANIEPAAGEAAGAISPGRGYGFQSDFEAQGVIQINDVGPIDPTELQYDLREREEDVFFETQGSTTLNPTFEIGDAQTYEDTSIDNLFLVSPDVSDSTLTVVISNIPEGWTVSADAPDTSGGTVTGVFDAAAGTWTVVLTGGNGLSGSPVFTPPADSDADALNLGISLNEVQDGTGFEGSASGTFNIIVDAVADAPELDALDDSGDEGEALDVDLSALTGEEVNNGVGSDDGSESIVKYQISGIPDGFTPSAGTEVSPGVWEFTPAEIVGLTITPSDPNFFGSIDLVATVFTVDTATDGEFDDTNNEAQASDPFTLTWAPVINPPSIEVNGGVDDVIVSEDGTVDVPVVAALGENAAAGEFLTVTITGIDPDWGFSAPIGDYDAASGTWTVVLPAGENLDTALTFTPPADSDIDLSGLVATVTATDPDAGISASADPDTFNIIVDAVADAPELDALDDSGDEGEALDVDLSALTGEEVNNGVGSDDGSESIVKYQISGIPDGFTPSAGTEVSPGVWEFTPAEIVGLTITPSDPNFFGSIDLVATVFTVDTATDGEFDDTNNEAQASDPFTLTWAPVINPPSIEVNGGVDDVIVSEDGTVDVPVVAALGENAAAGEFLTVTITGIDPDWGFSGPIGDYDAASGTWTVVLPAGENLDTALTFTPPADSDIDLSGLVATVTATDPDAGISASADPDTFNIIVDAVADTPELEANAASGEEGTTIPLTITTSVTDIDGSEVIEVIKITGVPAGVTLTAGTYDDVNDVWLLDPADLVGLGLNVPDGVTGSFDLGVESVAFEENLNGEEVDLTNNRASAFDTITVTIAADDIPVIKDDAVTVDETDLAPTTEVSGTVDVDFGADSPGTVSGNGGFFVGDLKSGGVDVDVEFDVGTNTYTGTADGAPVFTLVIESDGDYTFTLEGVLDHPDATDHNDALKLEFGVTATDSEGDAPATDGVISVSVLDDGPSLDYRLKAIIESTLSDGDIVYTNTLNHDFGADGPGAIAPTGSFMAKFKVDGPVEDLTSGGELISVNLNGTGDGYVGTLSDGSVIFSVVVDPLTGEYTYTQKAAIDHPGVDLGSPDDVIWLMFEVAITDADGDTDVEIIGIDLHDGVPVAHDDCVEFNASEGVLEGDVTANDEFSVDADNTVTQVKFGDTVVDVPSDGSDTTIEGEFGTLTINNTGAYSYESADDAFDPTYVYNIDNPPGSANGGDIKNVNTSFDEGSNELSFSLTVDAISDGFTVAINGGPNPKGHGGEMALLYFDASGAEPIVSVYAYNGANTQTSWTDGSAAGGVQPSDQILNSIANGDLFSGLSVTTDADGNKVFSFTLDASVIQDHVPTYGDASDWSGVSFADQIGIWLHPVRGLESEYGDDGYLTQWSIDGQGYYDTSYQDASEVHDECVEDVFEYVLTDADGDTSTADLKIKTFDDNDAPSDLVTSDIVVDETDLGPVDQDGLVTAEFGNDGPGVFTPSDAASFTVVSGAAGSELTSNGEPVDVTIEGTSYVGRADGEIIFTLDITEGGSYTFNLIGQLDHADTTDPDDVIKLEFGVRASDDSGDTLDGVISVSVLDDGPSLDYRLKAIIESTLSDGDIVYTNTLNHDFGADGPGAIAPTGSFMAKFKVDGPVEDLTSGGELISVNLNGTGDGYVGTLSDGSVIFSVVVDPLTGEYTYTQKAAIDHPGVDLGSPDDVIWLMFEVAITDADGDTDVEIIGIDLHDGVPVAHDDCVEFNASEGVLEGDVTANDEFSVDADNTVTQVKFGDTVVDVPSDGSDTTIEGEFGTLTINNTGAYSYESADDAFDPTYVYNIDNPPGSANGGDIKNVNTSFDEGSNELSFSLTVDAISDGFTVAINGGPNPKGHGGEMALLYFDASGAEPIVSVYAYNGANTQTSWTDGSAAGGVQPSDQILNSIANGDLFSGLSVTTDADGNKVFSFTLDASVIQDHVPTYGDASDWSGVSFADQIGIWLHPVRGLESEYGDDGYLTQWSIDGQGYYDTSYQDASEVHDECVEDVFEYVLTDADGDTSTADLKIKTFDDLGELIVGKNVDDIESSDVEHLVNGDEGIIEGGIGDDILVGDSGGSFLVEQTQDYNFVFILDTSGSMGSVDSDTSRITLLKEAVENLLSDVSTYDGGDVVVHLVPFAESVKTTGTFTITDADQLQALNDYLDALGTGGFTNYEDPLQAAIEWLESDQPLDGDAITTTYFISDGEPNRYINGAGGVSGGNASTSIGEATGSDGTNEVAMLQALNDDVIAVGINIGSAGLANLNVIDLGGNAINIDDANDLSVTLADTNPLNKLIAAGGDEINGGDGSDIIFGDVLFTDGLADLQGIDARDGSGWSVFERLENGEGSDTDWTRDDSVAYIRDNAEALSQESVDGDGVGRVGGNDVINGGAGDDVIFGQEGHDVISGGLGEDVLYGGSGADIFLFNAIDEGVDTIMDFDASEGDLLDLSSLIAGYDALTDDIADFVIATEDAGNTVISVDQTGAGNAASAVEVTVLDGVVGLDLDTSIKTDTIV